MGDGKRTYRDMLGKPEGKEQLERPGRRWEDNIKNGSFRSGMGAWTGLCYFRLPPRSSSEYWKLLTDVSGQHIGRIIWTFGFHIMLGISRLDDKRLACQ